MSLQAAVLKHIRDNPGVTGEVLARTFNVKFQPPATTDVIGSIYMSEVLKALESPKLIVRVGRGKEATFTISDRWAGVQRALSISLTDLAARQTGKVMSVNPIFGAPVRPKSESPSVFVIMPFAAEMNPVYDTIQKAVLRCDMLPVRADNLFSSSEPSVIQQVWSAMVASQCVIADCTGRNPNVMYELGMAHTLGKRVILLSQNKQDIAFDVGHLRFVVYKTTDVGLTSLRLEIENGLQPDAPRPRLDSLSDE